MSGPSSASSDSTADGAASRTIFDRVVSEENDTHNQLSPEEATAYAPFNTIEETKDRLGWIGVFLNHVISLNRPNELMLYLKLDSFMRFPTEGAARGMYDSFLSSGAPAAPVFLPPDLPHDLEDALNTRPANLAFIKDLLADLVDPVHTDVQAELDSFREMLMEPGGGDNAGAARLLEIANPSPGFRGTEAGLVKELLLPHLGRLRKKTKSKAESRLMAVHEGALLDFFYSHGFELSDETGFKGSTKARAESLRKQSSRSKAGRKIHLHRGHHFVVTSYSHPTYCGHCGKLLWGLMKQGWQCVDCKFNLHKSGDRTGHKNCHREFSHQCPGTVIVKPRSGSFRKEKEKVDGDASPQKPSALNRPSGPDGKADLAHRTGSTSSNSFAAVPSYRKRSMYLMPGQSSENIASDVDDDDSDSDDESFKQPLQIGPDGVDLPTLQDEGTFTEFVGVETAKAIKAARKKELDRQEAIYEFIQTEIGYYRHLMIMNHHFRWAVMSSNLAQDQIYQLFGNITQLLPFHKAFSEKLKALQEQHAGEAIPGIGAVVKEGMLGIRSPAYAMFTSNQNTALEMYHDLDENPELIKLKNIVGFCESNAICNRLSYADFLAKPLQRLTKYPLLIRELLKNQPDDATEDTALLGEASEAAKEILNSCQKTMIDADIQNKLQDFAMLSAFSSDINQLEKQFIVDLHLGDRTIVHEGQLGFPETNAYSDRKDKMVELSAVLCDDVLILFKKAPASKDYNWSVSRLGNKQLHPEILLGSVIAKPVATNDKNFYVIRTTKFGLEEGAMGPQMYELVANSKQEADDWIAKITATNQKFEDTHPGWEKQISTMSNAYEYPRPRLPSAGSITSSNKSGESCIGSSGSIVSQGSGRKFRGAFSRSREGSQPKRKMTTGNMAKMCDEFMQAVSAFQRACPDEAGMVEEKMGHVLESLAGFKTTLDNLERFRSMSERVASAASDGAGSSESPGGRAANKHGQSATIGHGFRLPVEPSSPSVGSPLSGPLCRHPAPDGGGSPDPPAFSRPAYSPGSAPTTLRRAREEPVAPIASVASGTHDDVHSDDVPGTPVNRAASSSSTVSATSIDFVVPPPTAFGPRTLTLDNSGSDSGSDSGPEEFV